MVMHKTMIAIDAAGVGYGLLLFADSTLFAQAGGGEMGTPTSIIGAFIAISLSMSALVGLIVKKLLDNAAEDRNKFTATLQEIEDNNNKRSAAEDARIQALIRATDERGDKLRMLFSDELERQRQYDDKRREALEGLVIRLSQNFRVAVHDVKDTAQAVVSKADLDRMKREREAGQ